MPNPDKLLATIQRATNVFRCTAGRHGGMLHLQDCEEVMVAGDLHGNVQNLSVLLQHAKLKELPRRHLILQELIHGSFRYPDGSDRSHQLLDLLAALKCQFPNQVHFLLGNHELAQWKNRRIAKNDECYNELFLQGVRHAYGQAADAIYAAYLEMFAAAALAIYTPNRVILSHSLPTGQHVSHFDPVRLTDDSWHEGEIDTQSDIYQLVWGRDYRESTVLAYLQKVGADFVITGHVPCENGFDFPNSYQLVLDSLAHPAYYCLFSTSQQANAESMQHCLHRLKIA